MPQINLARREITCKLVYYGPGLSGKTTNLEVIHKRAPADKRGELTNIATEGDRTLFFDFMPLNLGQVGGLTVKLQLYTVPGQEYYRATRRLVLQGVDGVVFVGDSQPDKQEENLSSWEDLERNLEEQTVTLRELPHVLQFNKRDLPGALPLEQLDALNRYGAPSFEAVAVTGEGVFMTLKRLSTLVLEDLRRKWGVEPTAADLAGPPAAAPPQPVAQPEAPPPAPTTRAARRPPGPAARPRTRPAPRPQPAPVLAVAPRAPLRRRLRLLGALLLLALAAGLGARGALPAPLQRGYARLVRALQVLLGE